jgi:predicted nuclease of predicted toxin-antitoxin system
LARKSLKVLIDEQIPNGLATQLLEHPSLRGAYVRNMPSLKGREDKIIMNYACESGSILITAESGINEKTFPICTHPGIIIFSSRLRHQDLHADIFQRFMRSGHRKLAAHHVLYLYLRSVRVLFGASETIYTI